LRLEATHLILLLKQCTTMKTARMFYELIYISHST
jgi:hypothetical protein